MHFVLAEFTLSIGNSILELELALKMVEELKKQPDVLDRHTLDGGFKLKHDQGGVSGGDQGEGGCGT